MASHRRLWEQRGVDQPATGWPIHVGLCSGQGTHWSHKADDALLQEARVYVIGPLPSTLHADA